MAIATLSNIYRIYKLNNSEAEYCGPEKCPIMFRDAIEGVAGIGLVVLLAICVGSTVYFFVRYIINLDVTPVVAVFAVLLCGLSMEGETLAGTVFCLLIFGVPACLFFTIFPYSETLSISSPKFLVGAAAGLILGWCNTKLFKLIFARSG